MPSDGPFPVPLIARIEAIQGELRDLAADARRAGLSEFSQDQVALAVRAVGRVASELED
jgi:hypothetical protein